MALTTLVAGNTITASGLNDNFSFCVLTDTAKTISVTHTYSASQTFSAGWTAAAACTITAASATALTVGRQGATDPVLLVHSSTATQTTGISVTGAAAAGGVAIAAISSGSNEALTIDAKGSGTVTIGATSTGNVVLGDAFTCTSAGAVSGITTLAAGTNNTVATFTTSGSNVSIAKFVSSSASNGGIVTIENSTGSSGTFRNWALATNYNTAGALEFIASAAELGTPLSGGTAALKLTGAGAATVLGAFGCNTKAAQGAYASGGALAAYGAGANGLDSGANMSALHALVVAIRAALVANGIMS